MYSAFSAQRTTQIDVLVYHIICPGAIQGGPKTWRYFDYSHP